MAGRFRRFLFLSALLPAMSFSQALTRQPITTPSDIIDTFDALMGRWLITADSYATELFWALAGLDVAWFGIQLWRQSRSDLSTAMMESTYKLLTIGIALALLLNGSVWMPMIIDAFVTIGKEGSGVPTLSPSLILRTGLEISGTLFGTAVGVGALVDLAGSIGLLVAAALILAAFLVLTLQFVMAKIDVFLTLGLGHIFLGFGGSRWTTPYLERYFALSVSTGVRLMVTYALIGGGWSLTNSWVAAAQTAVLNPASIETSWALAASALLYACVCWFSSKLISSLLSGTPAFSGGEALSFIAPMISAGVSGGLIAAGVVTGGATTAVGAAGAAASASGGAVSSGAASPSGGSTPGSTPPISGRSGGATAGLQAVGAAARALQSMPHGGNHSSPPHFDGFRH